MTRAATSSPNPRLSNYLAAQPARAGREWVGANHRDWHDSELVLEKRRPCVLVGLALLLPSRGADEGTCPNCATSRLGLVAPLRQPPRRGSRAHPSDAEDGKLPRIRR